MSTPTPHDAFAQAVFSDPEQAAVIFRTVLPEALLRRLDLAKAELQPSLFTSDELTGRRADFLFKVPLDGEDAYLLTLLEHQSTVDGLLPARALIYAGRALDRHLRLHPHAQRVPAVIPIVLFHGEGGWTAATELFDLYALPDDLAPVLRHVVPSLGLLVDDLSATDDEHLRQRPGPVLARLALIVMRHAQALRTAPDPRTVLRALASSVGDLLQHVVERTGRTVYMPELVELEPEEGEQVLVRALPAKVKEDVVTAAEKLRVQGRLAGKRSLLLAQLTTKFGSVAAEIEARVEEADEGRLDEWARRVVTVDALDEVFTTAGPERAPPSS
jgi:hypothetical protein